VTVAIHGLLAAAALALPAAHPLHTTHTELAERGGTIAVTIRAFTDDLVKAAGKRRPDGAPDDSAVAGYVRTRLLLHDRTGRPLALQYLEQRSQGGLTLLALRGPAARLAGVRITNRLQVELFPDQVNIVQARYGGRTATLVFTAGSGAKVLP
jgi:hypothetical protein